MSGHEMESSHVIEQLSSFLESCTGKTITASLLRKSCVTRVYAERPYLKTNLAQHMNHTVRTAESVYFAQEKKKKSTKTAQA